MQAADDPYSTIKDLISSEIHHITGLQAQLFSGKVSANSCSQQLNASFRDVQEQLVALEAAVKNMVDSPAKFNLDPTTAFMRQVGRDCGAGRQRVLGSACMSHMGLVVQDSKKCSRSKTSRTVADAQMLVEQRGAAAIALYMRNWPGCGCLHVHLEHLARCT